VALNGPPEYEYVPDSPPENWRVSIGLVSLNGFMMSQTEVSVCQSSAPPTMRYGAAHPAAILASLREFSTKLARSSVGQQAPQSFNKDQVIDCLLRVLAIQPAAAIALRMTWSSNLLQGRQGILDIL